MKYSELVNVIRTEDDAVFFLQEKGLLHNPRSCGNGHDMVLQLGNRLRWCCRKRACREYKSIRQGTWFERSRLPFRTIILFIYSWCDQSASVKYCKRELKINHNTYVEWTNCLRGVCASVLVNNQMCIRDSTMTVL